MAAREIRSIEKRIGVNSVPIVALTATPNGEDQRECYEAGVDGFLTKPFTSEQLLQSIALYAAGGVCNHGHPLYEYARSLEDMEPVFANKAHKGRQIWVANEVFGRLTRQISVPIRT